MNSTWVVLLASITTLVTPSTASAKSNGWFNSPSPVTPPKERTMRSKKVIGLSKTRCDDELPYSEIELKSLISHTSTNNSVSWLSNENSAISHHKLEKAQITLRGGADETTIDDKVIPSPTRKKPTPTIYFISKFAKWYMKQMETHELRTKCISSGILGLVGDVCAQEVGHYLTQQSILESNSMTPSIPDATGWIGMLNRLDKRRMVAMFSDGALTTGPLLHFVYEWCESILPIPEIDESSIQSPQEKRTAVRKRFTTALIHVLFDNFIMAILYVFLMMTITAILEGKYASIPDEIRHDFLPAIHASWKASLMGLAPMQLLSFHFLPMELRVLAVNVQDVIWVTVMSYVTHRNRH